MLRNNTMWVNFVQCLHYFATFFVLGNATVDSLYINGGIVRNDDNADIRHANVWGKDRNNEPGVLIDRVATESTGFYHFIPHQF